MRVGDSEERPRMARLILLVDDDVLRSSDPLFITKHDDSNLICIGIGKVVATRVRIWIKVKRDLTTLIRWQCAGQLECLLIKVNSRMGLVKHALKYGQGVTIKVKLWIRVALIMMGNTMIKNICKAPVVMDVELGISRMQTLGRKNRASLVNELSTQDIGIRTTTVVDGRISFLANRSHC